MMILAIAMTLHNDPAIQRRRTELSIKLPRKTVGGLAGEGERGDKFMATTYTSRALTRRRCLGPRAGSPR